MILNKLFFTFFAFVSAATAQFIWPHQNNIQKNLQNWKVNIPLGLFNALIFTFFLGSIFYSATNIIKPYWPGLFYLAKLPVELQIVTTVIILDFLSYALHRLYHQQKKLWYFHAVHHSDTVFETSTALRFHFGEILISFIARLGVALLLGTPTAALVVYEVTFQFFNFVQHSDFNLPSKLDHFLLKIFITPSLHRRHHSNLNTDLNSNYGTIFSVWDKLFNSFNGRAPAEVISVGCPEQEHMTNIPQILLYPLKKIYRGF